MEKYEIIGKVIKKKEFSKLPFIDIELAYKHFEKRQVSCEEKIRLTRELLHKVFGAFSSKKLLSPKSKDFEWILRKHLSTRERLTYYEDVYARIFNDTKEKISVFDLGAGINGFSYRFFPRQVDYVGVESVGQLVELMNTYFKENKFSGKAIHLSLFNLDKLKEVIKNKKTKKVIFLFKVVDSLESLEENYSKKLLTELVPLADKVVVSFATKSMISRKSFKVKRNWIIDFIKDNFNVLDDFEIGGERYVSFTRNLSH